MPFVDRRGDRQRIQEIARAELLDTLTIDAGRASDTTASNRTFTGGGLNLQRFLRPPTGPNDEVDLQLAPLFAANGRRALNRGRGLA